MVPPGSCRSLRRPNNQLPRSYIAFPTYSTPIPDCLSDILNSVDNVIDDIAGYLIRSLRDRLDGLPAILNAIGDGAQAKHIACEYRGNLSAGNNSLSCINCPSKGLVDNRVAIFELFFKLLEAS